MVAATLSSMFCAACAELAGRGSCRVLAGMMAQCTSCRSIHMHSWLLQYYPLKHELATQLCFTCSLLAADSPASMAALKASSCCSTATICACTTQHATARSSMHSRRGNMYALSGRHNECCDADDVFLCWILENVWCWKSAQSAGTSGKYKLTWCLPSSALIASCCCSSAWFCSCSCPATANLQIQSSTWKQLVMG